VSIKDTMEFETIALKMVILPKPWFPKESLSVLRRGTASVRRLPFIFVVKIQAKVRLRFRSRNLDRNLSPRAVFAKESIDRF